MGYFLCYYTTKGGQMVKIDRSFVLKNFLDKVYDAKRQNMPEVRMPIKELDDLAYVIYQLMAEKLSPILNLSDTQQEEEIVKPRRKQRPVVIQEFKVNKVSTQPQKELIEEKTIEKIKEPEYTDTTFENGFDDEFDDEFDDSDGGTFLYGGTF